MLTGTGDMMVAVCITGKNKSRSTLQIIKNTPAKSYGPGPVDLIVNYGLPMKRLETFLRKNPRANRVPILNRYIGRPKHLAISDAVNEGVLCPETCLTLPKRAKLSSWIEKRMHSSCGRGIREARQKTPMQGKYYQQMISNRRFEIRVHCFSWLPKDQWQIQKRVGPKDQIAWNFHQGGHFQRVHTPLNFKVFKDSLDIAEKILKIRHMNFGAVDLIVTDDYKIHFIEINSCPGFTELSAPIYFDAITGLTKMTKAEVKKI